VKVLVLGVTGMLGSAVFNELYKDKTLDVRGTLRSNSMLRYFSNEKHANLHCNVDVLDNDSLVDLMANVQPEVVINCVGLIKQLADATEPLSVLPINAMLPHRLSKLCALSNSRLIHISTDCVFNGKKGSYIEEDTSDAEDLYGKSKYIGEVVNQPHVVTLRTSIIGHELNSKASLVDWFLSQEVSVKGYKKAIFSGLTTVELAGVIKDYVLPKPNISGLYHVSVDAIDKHSLLSLIAIIYGKEIEIEEDVSICIDRSLDSSKFRQITGYQPQSWPKLIQKMYQLNFEGK